MSGDNFIGVMAVLMAVSAISSGCRLGLLPNCFVEPPVRIELTTFSLRVRRSTVFGAVITGKTPET